MICPVCKSPTTVIDSRSDPKGVYRRRVCKKCNYKFYTTETISDGSGLRGAVKKMKWEKESKEV